MRRTVSLILGLLIFLSLSVLACAEAPTDAESSVSVIIDILRTNPRRLVFTEGTDARILEAATRLKQDGLIIPVLIGNVDEVRAAAAEGGFDIEGLEIIDPATYPDMDRFVDDFMVLRKGKATADDARKMLQRPNYFGTMLVKEGLADGLLGGATYSTADTVRPALQLVKTREGANLVSSCMILVRACSASSGKAKEA